MAAATARSFLAESSSSDIRVSDRNGFAVLLLHEIGTSLSGGSGSSATFKPGFHPDRIAPPGGRCACSLEHRGGGPVLSRRPGGAGREQHFVDGPLWCSAADAFCRCMSRVHYIVVLAYARAKAT